MQGVTRDCPDNKLAQMQDVIAAANRKWGGLQGLQMQRFQDQQRRNSKKYSNIAKTTHKREHWEASEKGQAQLACEAENSARTAAMFANGPAHRDELLASLSKRGLRSDSKLCNAYIRSGVGNVDLIAETMVEMKWLFDNTDYAAKIKEVCRIQAFKHHLCILTMQCDDQCHVLGKGFPQWQGPVLVPYVCMRKDSVTPVKGDVDIYLPVYMLRYN